MLGDPFPLVELSSTVANSWKKPLPLLRDDKKISPKGEQVLGGMGILLLQECAIDSGSWPSEILCCKVP